MERIIQIFHTAKQLLKKFKNNKLPALTPLGLALTACGGGSRENNISANEVFAQKIPFDISSVNLNDLPWLTPASGGFFGKPALINNGDQNIIIIPAMFNVEHGSFQTNTPEGHLFVFTRANGVFKQAENINFVGAPRPYLYDFNNDGVNEIVGITTGEDGRIIQSEADVGTRPFYYDFMDGNVIYFGATQWQHASAFEDVNYDGIPDLIVAPIGYEPQSVVYNILDFSEISIQHTFKGHGEGEIAFTDLDGDGLLEFVETDSSWDGALNNNALMIDVYEINMDGSVAKVQSVQFGELDGNRFLFKEWNGAEESNYYTGNAFGIDFNLLHRWHSEFIDIDGDLDEDLLLIYSIDDNPSDLSSEDSNYVNPIHIITIDAVDGALDYSTLVVTPVPTNSVGKGWSFMDLDGDSFIDMYLDIDLMPSSFTGSDLGDRIWLNDGSGLFNPIGDRADDSFYGKEFMSSGEYSIYNMDGELYLAGVTSQLNGSDLSFISIPITDII